MDCATSSSFIGQPLVKCSSLLWSINTKEPETELGLVAIDGSDRVPVADALDLGDEGARGGRVDSKW